MKLTSTLALGFAAALLWNCNNTTQPESRAIDSKVPAIVNSVANYAAYSAGFQSIEVSAMGPVDTTEDENPFGPEGLSALEGLGLCPNFILIVQELINSLQNINPGNEQSFDPFSASPRLATAFQCLETKAKSFSASVQPSEAEAIALIDECMCAGSGTLFGSYLFAAYRAPGVPGNAYAAPGVPGNGYAAPGVSGGYSAPAVPGQGYAPPSL